jgi:pimeloyl-ACP methyl ester carboxylesterase
VLGRFAAVFTVVVLLATACNRGSTSTAAKPSPSPSSSPTAEALNWTSCGGGFQCASLTVPLDYSNPTNGKTIQLALIRKPATDQANRIGSVLTNPGGPGASGIQYLRQAAGSMTNLNRRFDLVGFDPRGVGGSAPVRCLSGPQEDAFNALDPVWDDPQEKAAGIQADKNFAAGCMSMSGDVLPFVDTESAARDMDQIRAAVGDAKLTYLGFSYGTFLGQTYAHLFPTHVRALSLDGVVDPTVSPNDMLLEQVKSFQKNLDAYAAGCQARTSCQFGRSGNLEGKISALLQQLDNSPMHVGSRELTRSLAIIGIITPLYDPSTWTYLDQGLSAAAQGNGSLLLQFSDLYLARHPDGTYDNENDANYAINCLDRPVPSDVSAYDALGASYAAASPILGAAEQYSNLVCAYWPVPAKGHVGPLTAPGAPPILLVGGTDDPATPYAWAQAVNQQISNSVLLTRQGNGHVSYDKSQCAQQAEDAYLINLTLPAPGTVCTDSQ